MIDPKVTEKLSDIVIKANSTSPPYKSVSCIALSTNDSYLIISGYGQLDLYQNVHRKKLVSLYKPDQVPLNNHFATISKFLPSDNNYVISALQSGYVLINWVSKTQQWKYEVHSAAVSDIAICTKENKEDVIVYTVSIDGSLKQWNLTIIEPKQPTLQEQREITIPPKSNISLRLSPHEKSQLLIVQDSLIMLYDQLQFISEWRPPTDTTILDSSYSAKGEWIYVLLNNCTIIVLNPKLCLQYYVRMMNIDSPVTAFTCNPTNVNQIAVGTESGQVILIDINK